MLMLQLSLVVCFFHANCESLINYCILTSIRVWCRYNMTGNGSYVRMKRDHDSIRFM